MELFIGDVLESDSTRGGVSSANTAQINSGAAIVGDDNQSRPHYGGSHLQVESVFWSVCMCMCVHLITIQYYRLHIAE